MLPKSRLAGTKNYGAILRHFIFDETIGQHSKMIIGGIQKTSLIDYPSKISCVIFVSGCNFDCPYCHNPDLVKRSSSNLLIDVYEVLEFLKKRRPLLDGIVITGGEPTLQGDLFGFCEQIKTLGYPVKLDTNGSRPGVIKQLIEKKLIDYIAMDIKTAPDRYSPDITKTYNSDDLCGSIKFIKESGLPHEFRTTCVRSIVDKDAILAIARLISGADLYVLQKVKIKNVTVLHPQYFKTHKWYYDTQAIDNFRAIASTFVKNIIIR